MNLTIDLPEHTTAALESQARAASMSAEHYLAYIVARAIESRHRQDVENLERHLDDMASQVAPETTPEQMEAALEEALAHVRPQRLWTR